MRLDRSGAAAPVLALAAAIAVATRAPAPGAPGPTAVLASAAWVGAGIAWMRGAPPAAICDAAELAGRLDPTWSVPWVYGALMAREGGGTAEAQALLATGMSIRTEEPTLPAMLQAMRSQDRE